MARHRWWYTRKKSAIVDDMGAVTGLDVDGSRGGPSRDGGQVTSGTLG
jgi:hypothetical protein